MFRVLFIVVMGLAAVDLVSMAVVLLADRPSLTFESDLVQLFDFDYERSLPTWLQTVMIAACAALLLVIGAGHGQNGLRRHGLYWVVLAAIFFSISADEMLSVHEQSIVPLRNVFGITDGLFYFAWIIPATVLLVLLAIGFFPFFRTLPPETLRQFTIAGVVFLGGAIGAEVIGGAYVSSERGGHDAVYRVITTVEELLEMLGIVVLLRALLSYLARGGGMIRISSPDAWAIAPDPRQGVSVAFARRPESRRWRRRTGRRLPRCGAIAARR